MARYGQKLEELRGLAQQVTAIDALGTEEQREQLQDLVDQVHIPSTPCRPTTL